MADTASLQPESEQHDALPSAFFAESSAVGLNNTRWTVCAMLFAATSINYMDRQVIAILKPTLEQSIGLTEVGYGYIVDAFQIAYAIGLLFAGRLIEIGRADARSKHDQLARFFANRLAAADAS